jgi:hypothetical protein
MVPKVYVHSSRVIYKKPVCVEGIANKVSDEDMVCHLQPSVFIYVHPALRTKGYHIDQPRFNSKSALMRCLVSVGFGVVYTGIRSILTPNYISTAPALEFWNPLESSGTGNFAGLQISL